MIVRYVPNNEFLALINANSPNGTNPYATMADLAVIKPTIVNNYAALPDPTTVLGKFYFCLTSQGTSWLPGSLGGNYYPEGLYYSNGVSWYYTKFPYQATQTDVDAGTNNDKFVTPMTLEGTKLIKQGLDTIENVRYVAAMDETEYASITPTNQTIYFIEETNPDGWERYVDTTNTQALIGGNNNTLDIGGAHYSSNINIINVTTNKIIPTRLNDYIIVDIAYTVETPTGNNNHIETQILVNGLVYRATTNLLLKSSGNDNTVSMSFAMSVESDFLIHGAIINIIPNVNLIIKNRFVSVVKVYSEL